MHKTKLKKSSAFEILIKGFELFSYSIYSLSGKLKQLEMTDKLSAAKAYISFDFCLNQLFADFEMQFILGGI